jgi:ABC-2 family transporter protein
MHAIARFVGLDLRSLRPSAKYMIIPVAIVVAPVLLLSSLLQAGFYGGEAGGFPAGSGPYMLIPAMSFLAVVNAPQSLFSNDALGRLDTLYAALGIRRRHVVAGRYATCLLLLIALTIAGVLLAPVAALAFGAAFDWAIAAALAAGSVALIGIFLAAELPAFFGTGPGPVRTVAAIPPVIILTLLFGGWAIPDVRTVLLSWLSDANVAWLALAAIAVLGVLGAASTALSARLYARRDL